MNWFKIPLTPVILQVFQIALAGSNYLMTVKWNDADEGGWIFDLVDADTNESIVAGSPLITGANCLSGLGYLGIDGFFVVFTDGNPDAVPTFENLGTESNLYFLTDVASNG